MTACATSIYTGFRKLVAPLDRPALPGNGADHHSGGTPLGRPLNSSPLSSYTLIYEDLLAVTCYRSSHQRLPPLPPHYYHCHTLPSLPFEAYTTIHSLPPPHHHQVGVLLPMLLASSHCANLFTESCNTLIGESFAICATFMQRLRQF